jgi:hypothetical protein
MHVLDDASILSEVKSSLSPFDIARRQVPFFPLMAAPSIHSKGPEFIDCLLMVSSSEEEQEHGTTWETWMGLASGG